MGSTVKKNLHFLCEKEQNGYGEFEETLGVGVRRVQTFLVNHAPAQVEIGIVLKVVGEYITHGENHDTQQRGPDKHTLDGWNLLST